MPEHFKTDDESYVTMASHVRINFKHRPVSCSDGIMASSHDCGAESIPKNQKLCLSCDHGT